MLFNSGLFLLVGCPVGLEQGGGAQRRSQSHSMALTSPRVPISRNVYQDNCCADALHRRIFLFGGVPGETLPPGHYFLLKKHVQALWKTVVSRGLHMLFCSALFLYCSQRFICCRICAISALE